MADGDGKPQGGDNAQIQALLDKHKGDAMSLALQLFGENFHLREKNRELKGKLPAEGTHVLTADEFKLYEAAKETGLKAEEVVPALAASADDKKEIARLKRKDTLRDVAQAHGYKLSVLEDLDGKAEGVEYVRKEEKDKGGQVKVTYHAKSEGKEVPLEQFAAERWADYMPALRAEQGANTAKSGHTRDPQPAGAGDKFAAVREAELKRQERIAPVRGSLKDRFLGRVPART